MCLRIQLSRATVKELHSRLRHAYQCDEVRLVRRITVLLDLLVHQVPVEVLSARWRLSPSPVSTTGQTSSVGHGQLGLIAMAGAPREVDSHAAETLGRVD